MRVTILTPLYTLAIAALLGLTACGGSGSSEPPPAAPAPPQSLHTGRVLLVGGNALINYDPLTKTITPRDFGPCADNEGRFNGNSTTTLGVFGLGVLNSYPSRVVIVADEFEIANAGYGWAELGYTADQIAEVEREAVRHALDNYTGAIVNAVASGARTTIVGIQGNPEFNAQLKTLARSYGAEYSDSIAVSCN